MVAREDNNQGMKPPLFIWFLQINIIIPICLGIRFDRHSSFTRDHLSELKSLTLDLFNHSWQSYKNFGFPADEVRPLTCEPYGPNYNDSNDLRNDAMGNVTLTLIDNLDTFIVLGQWDELLWALNYLHENQATIFHQNSIVQVFEASIRWLGGLLSTHLLLTDTKWPMDTKYHPIREIADQYDGFLLVLAYDLGLRLIPAYRTKHQLPLPRINLLLGLDAVPDHLNAETCTSGAITPVIEFTLLLKLTGDPQFEAATTATFWKLWNSRSNLGLLPMSIDPHNNEWIDSITGIGASVDSFYEYALKASILFNNDPMWLVFTRSYQSLLSHLASHRGINDPLLFVNVDTVKGDKASTWIDLLGAFWAGVQVLAGRLSDAVQSHVIYMKMWDFFDAVPERWSYMSVSPPSDPTSTKVQNAINLEWYPLRPEFIESTYYLFRATKDPMYLQIGLRILSVFKDRYTTPCGLAGVQDIRTGKLQNRMETFVMGETLKYLYLLFDEANESIVHHKLMAKRNWVFSTEAHPLWYNEEFGKLSSLNFNSTLHMLNSTSGFKDAEPHKRSFFRALYAKLSKSGYRMAEFDNEARETGAVIPENPLSVEWNHYGVSVTRYLESMDTCEIQPRQFTGVGRSFMHSGYYTWKQLFFPEATYPNTLVRPRYLKKYSKRTPNHYIELTEPFYHQYTMFEPLSKKITLQCPRFPTSGDSDYIIGDLSRPESYEMYIVQKASENSTFSVNDVIMPSLRGRLKLEVMTMGQIDTTNREINKDYIRKARPDTFVSKKSEVMRVNRINGASVGRYRTLWVWKENIQEGEFYRISKDGRIYIQGQYVENLRVFG